ncbi:MAG TPA: SpoIIE family protein phosphatase [Acidimicrobiia bacterium]|nr:SpoIIE family protein phosphatase [Acidimicrobiia bacterium]
MEISRRWWRRSPAVWPGWAVFLAVGTAYAALSQYVIWLNDPVNNGAGFWPGAGVSVAAVVVLPPRRWGWVLGAVVAAEILGDVARGYPLVASSYWAAGNAVEPLVAGAVLHRFAPGGRLVPVRNLLWFIGAAVALGPLAGALIGSIGTSVAFGRSWPEVAVKWWVGDALGVLSVAPLLLVARQPPSPWRSLTQGSALTLLVVLISVSVVQDWGPEADIVLPLVAIPALALIGLRFGIRAAVVAGFAVAQVANAANALGYGPFGLLSGESVHAVTVLQVFLAVALTVSLLVAALVTDTVERAKAVERHRSVADALQRAVLPPRLPEVDELALAARYVPASASSDVDVGGDWYDAFTHPDGTLSLAVGDVMGHGVEAAVVMAQLRNGMRSLAFEFDDPAAVLASLDRQLARTGEGMYATAIYAVLDRGVLRWASAGHVPMVVVRSDGSGELVSETPDILLGLGDSRYHTRTLRLGVGDLLVAFTDGLIEHRGRGIDVGLDRVCTLARAAAPLGPQAVCDLLLRQALDGLDRVDDACVLVVRRADVVDLRDAPAAPFRPDLSSPARP